MVSSQAGAPTRIMIVDDHPIVLSGLRAILQDEPAIRIVAEALNGEAALACAASVAPDVIVLDISMPGISGIELARQVLRADRRCKLLFLTVHSESAEIRKAFEAGARGYLLKSSAVGELARAIIAVAEGGMYLDPKIGAEIIQQTRLNTNIEEPRATHLTDREIEVMRLMAIGHTNKSIAAKLSIALKPVETHKSRAMVKLGFSSRVETVRFAISQGWLKDQALQASLPG